MILEDLLLGRRQFNPETERFLLAEVERTGRSRNEIIEAALVAYQAADPKAADQIGFQHASNSKHDKDRRGLVELMEREHDKKKEKGARE